MGLALWAHPLAFRVFDHRDGLPASQISTLLEDRDGFLWGGAGDSVFRLGASGFQVFAAAQGLGCRDVAVLFQDAGGSLWAGGAGLSELRGRVVRNYGAAQGLVAEDHVYSLAEGGPGDLYVGTRLGLYRKGPGGFAPVPLPGVWAQAPIYKLAGDGKGGIWLGSRKGLLAHWDGRTLRAFPLPAALSNPSVRGLQADPGGGVKVLFAKALFHLDPSGAWQPVALPGLQGHPDMIGFREDVRGNLMVFLGMEGFYLRTPEGEGRCTTYREGLSRHPVVTGLVDRSGRIWGGMDGGGLVGLPTPALRTLAYNARTGLDLQLGTVLQFLPLAGGRMLMGTVGGLVLWDDRQGLLRRWDVQDGLPAPEVWSLAPDAAGGAWVGTSRGMVHWRGGRLLPGPEALRDVMVAQLGAHLGRLFAATGQGLAEMDLQGRLLRLTPPPPEVGASSVTQFLPRPWGVLAGTQMGLFECREGRMLRAFPDAPVAKVAVSALEEDARGQLWVGSSQGLFARLGEAGDLRWKTLGGPLQNLISWVRRLPGGGVAVGHTKGVTLLPEEGPSIPLTRNLGLLSDETNQNAALVDGKGRLWIGMNGGVSILERMEPSMVVRPPAPRILEAQWAGESRWLPLRLVLPPHPPIAAFRFDLPLPCAGQAPRYQVMIQGLDPDWRPVEGDGTTVQIAQWGPGTYTFRVRATLDGVTWSEATACPVVVRRAWYQTFLARMGFLAAGVVLLVLLTHLQSRKFKDRARGLEDKVQARTRELALRNQALERLHVQLKENMEARLQVMNTLSHDLRSPLTSLLMGVERLRAAAQGEADPVLPLMEREVRRLDAMLKGLLDQGREDSMRNSLHMRLCRPSEILQGLTETFQIKAQALELSPRLELDPESDQVWVLADVAAMQQVLFNLIDNALKFTPPPGAVGIRSRAFRESWQLEVWDEGRGIEATKLQLIFLPFTQSQAGDERSGWGLGLNISKNIVDGHSGTLQVDSAPGRGSRFRVNLPLVLPEG